MKSYDLKPTTENLVQSFKKNVIGRNKDILSFCRLLNSIDDSFSIAVDGAWGSGKTFFVKQVKLVMDVQNPNIDNEELSDEQKSVFQIPMNEQNCAFFQPQVCVYYDAWENDNDEDPILSLVYTILQSADSDHAFPQDSSIIAKAAAILECFAGKNFTAVVDSFKKNTIFDEIRSKKDLESNIKEFLDELLEERGQRLVVFIDELDRCKPTYAVQLLERIKHYFDNDRITFVFSINAKELEHTIKRHYGNSFDSGKYLNRFFDLRVSLPKTEYPWFYQSIGLKDSHYWYDIWRKAFIEAYGLSMREVSRYYCATKVAGEKYIKSGAHYSNSSDLRAYEAILPIMIGLQTQEIEEYQSFVAGKNPEPLIKVAERISVHYFDFLLSNNEYFGEQKNKKADWKEIKLKDRILEYYSLLFSDEVRVLEYDIYRTEHAEISKDGLRELFDIASCLSDKADYDS